MANQFAESEPDVPVKRGPGRPPKVESAEDPMQARIDAAVQEAVAAALAGVRPVRPVSEQPVSLLEPKEVRQRKGAVILADWERESREAA